VNDSAAQKATEARLNVVMDRCMMAEHKRRSG
jgi:predicted CoA-binding protein